MERVTASKPTMKILQDPRDRTLECKPLVTSAMKAECIGEFHFEVEQTCYSCYEIEKDPECEVCGGEANYMQKVTVPWDTCKEIYKRMAAVAAREVKQ